MSDDRELLDAVIAYYVSRSWPSYQPSDWWRDMQFTNEMLMAQSRAVDRHSGKSRTVSKP